MADNIQDYYKRCIYRIHSNIIDIRAPVIAGTQNTVFFVETPWEKFVVKFNDEELIRKNLGAARLFARNDIPVPDLHIGSVRDRWYETYPILNGDTLYEKIGNGMPEHRIKRIYNHVINNFAKMDEISASILASFERARKVKYLTFLETSQDIPSS